MYTFFKNLMLVFYTFDATQRWWRGGSTALTLSPALTLTTDPSPSPSPGSSPSPSPSPSPNLF